MILPSRRDLKNWRLRVPRRKWSICFMRSSTLSRWQRRAWMESGMAVCIYTDTNKQGKTAAPSALLFPSHFFVMHPFVSFDGSFYLSISDTGYVAGDGKCAFYPLWPFIMRWVSALTGGSLVGTGFVLANLFSLAGWLLFYQIVLRRWGSKVAWWVLAYLIVFPGSLFYQFLYSESLFFLLLIGLWGALERERNGLAFAIALLLPLSRPIGVFCFLPILWHVLTVSPPKCLMRWPRLFAIFSESSYVLTTRNTSQARWLVCAPICGWLFYLLLMFLWTGNSFEGFAAQKYWSAHSISNLWNLPKFILGWLTPNTWHAFMGSLLDRYAFTLLIFCLPLIWKLDKKLIAWSYILGIIPAMSGTFTSYTRFTSVAFPLFIALGVFFSPPNRRWFGYGLLGIFGGLHVTLVWRYVNFQWAS